MIDAEKWYEYQAQYQKYGLDMKPERVKPEPRTRRRTVSPDERSKSSLKLFGVAAVSSLAIVCIAVIMITAFCANLKYDINQTVKANTAIQGEIENLEAKLYSVNNIGVIEGTATGTLGMVYPNKKNQIYVTNSDVPAEGFAVVLRDKAYN